MTRTLNIAGTIGGIIALGALAFVIRESVGYRRWMNDLRKGM